MPNNSPEPVATLIIVDDHPLFRGAMRQALSGGLDAGMAGIGPAAILEAGDFAQLQAQLLETPDIDLVLLDLSMLVVMALNNRADHIQPLPMRVPLRGGT